MRLFIYHLDVSPPADLMAKPTPRLELLIEGIYDNPTLAATATEILDPVRFPFGSVFMICDEYNKFWLCKGGRIIAWSR